MSHPIRRAHGATCLHPRRSSGPACRGQRSGTGKRLHGAMMALCSLPRTNPGNTSFSRNASTVPTSSS